MLGATLLVHLMERFPKASAGELALRYNALVRRLVSFERAAECVG